jgi:hypothetical protein
MEVTEIILAKVSRLCQLSNAVVGFCPGYRLWFSLGGGGGWLLAFLTFVHILLVTLFFASFFYIYFDETDSKQPKIHWNPYQPMVFSNLKKKSANQKSRDFCHMFVISDKENHMVILCDFHLGLRS